MSSLYILIRFKLFEGYIEYQLKFIKQWYISSLLISNQQFRTASIDREKLLTKTSNRPKIIGPITSGAIIQIKAGLKLLCSCPRLARRVNIAASQSVARKTNPTVLPAIKYPARNTTAASGGYCHIGSLTGKFPATRLLDHRSYSLTSLNKYLDSG